MLLQPFCIAIKKYKTIWTNIEDLQDIKINVLPVFDDGHIKTKIRTYGCKLQTNFHGLTVPEDGAECESCTIISIYFLLVCKKKYYPQACN